MVSSLQKSISKYGHACLLFLKYWHFRLCRSALHIQRIHMLGFSAAENSYLFETKEIFLVFFWNDSKVVDGCFFAIICRSWEQFGLCASSLNKCSTLDEIYLKKNVALRSSQVWTWTASFEYTWSTIATVSYL